MSDAETFGRQLLAAVLVELSSSAQRHRSCLPSVDAESFTAGLLSGMTLVGTNFPFEATALSHMQLAETLLLSFHRLSGDNDALAATEQSLNRIKEQLYGHATPNKSNSRLN